MWEYDLEGYMLGEDEDLLGQRRGGRSFRPFAGRRPSMRRPMRRPAFGRSMVRPGIGPGVPTKSPLMPVLPGAPGISGQRLPLGFGAHIFLNAAATQVQLTANPQKPVRPARLVVVVSRSAGATAEVVTIVDLQVGTNSQLAGSLALPAEAFGPAAEDVYLAGTSAQPGIDISLTIAVSAAPGVGESIGVSAVLFCDAVG